LDHLVDTDLVNHVLHKLYLGGGAFGGVSDCSSFALV
jgi:hypothetical protein